MPIFDFRLVVHRVLVWGIVGALVMRGMTIFLGVTLVERFHFVLYIFGAFLLVTAFRIFFGKAEQNDFETMASHALLPEAGFR